MVALIAAPSVDRVDLILKRSVAARSSGAALWFMPGRRPRPLDSMIPLAAWWFRRTGYSSGIKACGEGGWLPDGAGCLAVLTDSLCEHVFEDAHRTAVDDVIVGKGDDR